MDTDQWILVLDDDAIFRGLVSQILTAHGYLAFEARSARDATESLKLRQPLLAIVDYRLPEMDGLTWISRLRETGNDVPIVFLSGTFCDAQTFNKLRNILNVSLILQKPIVPELFMEQLESLLPKRQNYGSQQPLTPDVALYTIPEVRLPPQQEQALAEARKECALELPSMVQALAEAIQAAREHGNNRRLLSDACNEAHKLKGSAGSFGFARIAEDAARIERSIQALEPDDRSTMQEILWSEIIHHLADAETSASELASGDKPPVKTREKKSKSAHAVLVITDSDDIIDASLSLDENIAEAVVVGTLRHALVMLKTQHFDGVIVDHDVCADQSILDFTKNMRLLSGHEYLPMVLILTDKDAYGPSELLYLGCSLLIERPLILAIFEESVQLLISLYVPCLPRVLTVDDDPVLSGLIRKVLSAEDMIVHELNEPIRILDALEEFNPDIVLLDVIMPGLSGYDVCRVVRADERWRDLTVLFITSKSDSAGRAAAFQAGGNDFLAKPIVTSELISRVKAQVQSSPLIRQRMDRDPLTGLLQRNTFETALSRMAASAEHAHQPFTVCLMEIKDLDKIEQDRGSASIEQVFASLGRLLQVRFRTEDAKARLASFFVLLVEGQTLETVQEAVQILLAEFQNETFQDARGGHFKSSFIFGLAQLFRDTEDGTQVLQIALERLRNAEADFATAM